MIGRTVLDRYAKIYKKIGATLQRELPAGWCKTWAYAEMSPRDGGVVVYYLDATQKLAWITPSLALYERFRELNTASHGDPAMRWTTATFVLESNGTFDVDFDYAPVPIEDERERRAVWKLRYLPQPT